MPGYQINGMPNGSALTALMGKFIEDLLNQNMVQHQHIDIRGSISGGNIVLGGYRLSQGIW